MAKKESVKEEIKEEAPKSEAPKEEGILEKGKKKLSDVFRNESKKDSASKKLNEIPEGKMIKEGSYEIRGSREYPVYIDDPNFKLKKEKEEK